MPNTIPTTSNLTQINLASNLLTDIPTSFANLPKNLRLKLEKNSFSIFPEALTQIKKLKFLDLSNNQLVTLPKEVSNLQSLQSFYIRNNSFIEYPLILDKLNKDTYISIRYRQIKPNQKSQMKKLLLLFITIFLAQNSLSAQDYNFEGKLSELKAIHDDEDKRKALETLIIIVRESRRNCYP